jgi:hypothetical protein
VGTELAELVARKLFGQTETRPDMIVLEPEGKSRIIKVSSMREKIVEPMTRTSYSGGWKFGLIKCADRMNTESANAFLKSLEEPTAQTMYMLLTDNPEACLTTIVSRCQRIDLPRSSLLLEGEHYAALYEIFHSKFPKSVFERDVFAQRLLGVLTSIKDDCEDETVQVMKKSFYRTVLSFLREWMVEGSVERFRAFRNIEAVEEAFRRSEKSMSDDQVLSAMLDKLSFPKQ